MSAIKCCNRVVMRALQPTAGTGLALAETLIGLMHTCSGNQSILNYAVQKLTEAPMSDEKKMADENHVEHMFLHVESKDAVCVLNIAGHPYRLRELIYMMIENGCRVMKITADRYNTFSYDKETVEVYDYLTSIIKAKFI